MSEHRTPAESDSGAERLIADRRCRETWISVSDFHLSEGEIVRVRPRHPLALRISRFLSGREDSGSEAPFHQLRNQLEDFPHDAAWAAFLASMRAAVAESETIVLNMMGDIFDPLVVTWFGRFEDPPYETVGVRKMRRIMAGHRRFFDALAEFLKDPRCRINFFAGNHDQFLVWPRVQREIVRRLAGKDAVLAAKIGFVDHKSGFELCHRGVLYYHGNNAETQNIIRADSAIQTEHFGQNLKRPLLNKPDGSYMVERVVNRIKLRNHLVGRVNRGSDMWMYIFLYHRWWGIFAGLSVVWDFVWRHIAFWDVRRKTSLSATWKIVIDTLRDQPVDKMAERMLVERPGIKAVVFGHSHEWRRVSTSHGTYINTGTWSLAYDLFVGGKEVTWSRQILKLTAYWMLTLAAAVLLWRYAPYGTVAAGILLAVYTAIFTFFPLTTERPRIEPTSRLTFGLVRHYSDDSLTADTMEYLPDRNSIRECV